MVIFVVGSFPGTEMSIDTLRLEQEPDLDSMVMNSAEAFYSSLCKINSLSWLFDKSFILSYESKLFLVTLELFLDTYLNV